MRKEDYDSLATKSVNDLLIHGPSNPSILNNLSLLKYLNEDRFKTIENNVLAYMGLYYKKIDYDSSNLYDLVFKLNGEAIYKEYNQWLTPIQADIKQTILNKKVFMFSAPTSIGKSYILKDVLINSRTNVVVIVPTRALMNEYIYDIKNELVSKGIRDCNVLSFFETINTKHASRSIFVLTPERCFDLFNSNIDIGLFIFDEAQLMDSSEGIRAVKFRSLIKKINRTFSDIKKLFAYPFVNNLTDIKNTIYPQEDVSIKEYSYQNVGQLFTCITKANRYYAFNTENDIKIQLDDDPIEIALKNNGTVLVFTSKASIYSGKIYSEIDKYIKLSKGIMNPDEKEDAERIIKSIAEKIGSANGASRLVENMKIGVVIHHGSLPHNVGILIEEFIRKGYARICIATTTLEQGVNMPFDVVYIHHYYNLKTALDLKNLIGRAGRSTINNSIFDYGVIVTRDKRSFIERINKEVSVNYSNAVNVSEDDEELKKAIERDDIDSETNLPNSLVERLGEADIISAVRTILEIVFDENKCVKDAFSVQETKNIIDSFKTIYCCHLKNGRSLTNLEGFVFDETIRILLCKLRKLKFSEIVLRRFSYIKSQKFNYVKFIQLPDKKTVYAKLFDKIDKKEYYFDIVVCDTYEYIDKNINLYFKDIVLGALLQYKKNNLNSVSVDKLISLIRYGSDDYKEIMLYKYGFTDDEIDVLMDKISDISEEEVLFSNLDELEPELIEKCSFYIY